MRGLGGEGEIIFIIVFLPAFNTDNHCVLCGGGRGTSIDASVPVCGPRWVVALPPAAVLFQALRQPIGSQDALHALFLPRILSSPVRVHLLYYINLCISKFVNLIYIPIISIIINFC